MDDVKRILIAVDEGEHKQADRAALYVASLLGGLPGFRVTVLRLVIEPPGDFFDSDNERRDWVSASEAAAHEAVRRLREILVQSGFSEEAVDAVVRTKRDCTPSEGIMHEAKEVGACTVVVGRRGVSAKEEFLFGSTSSALLHKATNCALWVVE